MRGRISRRRRSSGPRRRNNWSSAFLASRSFTIPNDGSVLTAWAKWPAGLRDQGGGVPTEQEVTSVDNTLVRTIVGANVTLDLFGLTQTQVNVIGVFGLIAWDASQDAAGALDGVLTAAGEAPDPARDSSAEWVIRLPFTFTRDNFSLGNIAETFIVSRAMRKLPPRTGLLMCFGNLMPLDNSNDSANFDVTFDIRMLFKSGALAI